MLQRMQKKLASILSLLWLTACTAAPGDGAHLGNSQWRFVAIDGSSPVADTTRLDFADDEIGINVGCNGMGGPWRVEEGRLIAGPLIGTQMYCEGPLWDQEKAVGALMAGAPEVSVSGDRLVLRSSGHSAELVRSASDK